MEPSGILGFMCSLKKEYSTEKICCIFVMDDAPKFDPDSSFYRKQIDKKLSVNVWKNKQWGTYRHLLLPETKLVRRSTCCLDFIPFESISPFQWVEGEPLEDEIAFGGEDTITVYYAGLNSTVTNIDQADQTNRQRDISASTRFGFSGKNSKGERVMGICLDHSLRTLIRTKFFLPIPKEWTMIEAASVISAYSPVIALLLTGCQLKPCEAALIHRATDAIGIATVDICLHFGLTVFVTVQTEDQYSFIRDRYPNINANHISYFKQTCFKSMIRKHTNGKGVNYVFDSDWGCDFSASLCCLSKGGKFLHWSRRHFSGISKFSLNLLEKEIEIVPVTMDNQFLERFFGSYIKLINRFIFINNGAIKRFPKHNFNYKSIKEAINYMKEDNCIGEVLISFINEENIQVQSVPSFSHQVIPRLYCNPNCSYLISGGLGGFGIELADFLIKRGARKLVLSSRSGITNGYQAYKIRLWEGCGAKVVIKTDDASTKHGCTELLMAAYQLGPLDGIFNLAAVLRDSIFENQTEKSFKDALVAKVYTTQNLDVISRQLCPNLRYFVVFSSFAAGRGILGQTNYSMANSITDRICENRKDEGYPALAIQWAAVREVGIVARLQNGRSEIIDGTIPQRVSSCLQQLDKFIFQSEPVVASMVIAPTTYSSKNNLLEDILNILGIGNIEYLSMQSTLPELGLDSITTVDIKQILERKYDMFLEPGEMRTLSLASIKKMGGRTKEHII
ncbi:Zinc-binding dehydrogenase [Popillia japonica]|uniref:Zinc-binding dehydrogenase n=1 Tax=Popillia japonica TaxID=7064 RepID=A0AAW1LQS3_POPJA